MKYKILGFSIFFIILLFLIPSLIGVRKFGNIFSYTVIPICFFILGQRIKRRDYIYSLSLSIAGVYFLILGIDYLVNKTYYDIDTILGLACFYIALIIIGILLIPEK